MKQIIIYTTIIVLFTCLISACDKETGLTSTESKGYFEYQYKYTVDVNGKSTIKTGLKRIIITHAVFAPHQNKTLPDSLSKFNQMELFLYTSGADYANSTQPIGASFIQASLADTIPNPEKLSSFSYRISKFNDFAKLKVSACLSLKSKINKLNGNNDNDDSSYELVASGQNATYVYVTALDNGLYEVNAYGKINTTTDYRLYYKGQVTKKSN